MPFGIGPVELIIVLVIALLVIGPGKLPEVGAALGKSIREFRKATSDVQEATTLEPTARPAVASAAPAAPVAPAAAVAPATPSGSAPTTPEAPPDSQA
ncbi:MAG TPA: twin-arginine translocase TatA/TatE family subunit [Candidatus Limnocylindrales bacterium]